jgi:hypothetical protein
MDTLDQLDAALRRRVTATMNARPSAASAIAGGLASNSSSALTKSKSTDNASGSNTTKMDSGGVIGLDLSAMGLTPHEVFMRRNWKDTSSIGIMIYFSVPKPFFSEHLRTPDIV